MKSYEEYFCKLCAINGDSIRILDSSVGSALNQLGLPQLTFRKSIMSLDNLRMEIDINLYIRPQVYFDENREILRKVVIVMWKFNTIGPWVIITCITSYSYELKTKTTSPYWQENRVYWDPDTIVILIGGILYLVYVFLSFVSWVFLTSCQVLIFIRKWRTFKYGNGRSEEQISRVFDT